MSFSVNFYFIYLFLCTVCPYTICMNVKYIPILKTKHVIERRILINEPGIFLSNWIIPYLEITKPYSGDGDRYKTAPSMCDILKNTMHFEELYPKGTIPASLEDYKEIPDNPNIILSLRLNKNEWEKSKVEIAELIRTRKEKNLISAIRIVSGLDSTTLNEIHTILSERDWILVDIGENDYDATSFYMLKIQRLHHENTAVFSTERPSKISGEQYPNEEYDNLLLNTSVIRKLKEGEYPFKAFGSYASLKNNLTEGAATTCYGVFLAYSLEKNMFYSLRTQNRDHISHIYGETKKQVASDLKDKNSELSKIITNPRVMKYLEETLEKKNPRAVDFLTVSTMQYLTEIEKLLSS